MKGCCWVLALDDQIRHFPAVYGKRNLPPFIMLMNKNCPSRHRSRSELQSEPFLGGRGRDNPIREREPSATTTSPPSRLPTHSPLLYGAEPTTPAPATAATTYRADDASGNASLEPTQATTTTASTQCRRSSYYRTRRL